MYLLVFYLPIYWFPIDLYICWCSIYLSTGVLSTYQVVSQLSIYLSALVSFPPIYWCPIYLSTGVLPTYLLVSYQPKYHLLVSCLPIYWYPICLSTYLHCVFSTYLLVSYLPIYWCRRYLYYGDLCIYLLVSYLPPCLIY